MSNDNSTHELAKNIARGLGEPDLLPMYRRLVERYPVDIVRLAYEKTLEVPADKIQKSKGALFNYLLKQYAANQDTENPRD